MVIMNECNVSRQHQHQDQENSQGLEQNSSSNKRSAEQRKLTYRELLNEIEDIQETGEVGLQTAKAIGDILKEVNVLEEECVIDSRVQHAEETLLDSMVLSSASSVLVKCIESVDVFTCTYESSEFANRICEHIKNENEEDTEPMDLLGLLGDARAVIPDVPHYTPVYGTYDLDKVPVPKQKKERQKDPREKLQKKEPEKIKDVSKEESSIDDIVKGLYAVLLEEYNRNDEEPIKYYEYVIDSESFTNTVENMFYCSFLIRDGKALLDLDSRGEPYIKPMKKSDLKQMRDRGGANAQVITTISVEEWERYRKAGFIQQRRH